MGDDTPDRKFRQFLEEAQLDQRLLARFDLFSEFRAAMKRGDANAQREIAQKLKLNANEIVAEKARAAAAIAAAFEDAKAAADPDRRTAKLLRAFELAMKTKFWAYDAAGDIEAGNAAHDQDVAIIKALDAIPPRRRSALTVFLDNRDLGVRYSAAESLMNVMPERVKPILQEIHQQERGSSVGFQAMMALMRYPGEPLAPRGEKGDANKP